MWGPGPWFPVLPFGFMILCMVVMVLVMMYAMGMGPFRGRSRASALDILNERLASGDIDQVDRRGIGLPENDIAAPRRAYAPVAQHDIRESVAIDIPGMRRRPTGTPAGLATDREAALSR